MGYIYLAQGYSDKNPDVVEERYHRALEAVAVLVHGGWNPFSPIVHCHEVARQHGFCADFEFWERYNYTMMAGASGMFVLDGTGWQDSKGFAAEREYWQKAFPHQPIKLMVIMDDRGFMLNNLSTYGKRWS